MGDTHFLQTGYLLLNRNAPPILYNDPVQPVYQSFSLILRETLSAIASSAIWKRLDVPP